MRLLLDATLTRLDRRSTAEMLHDRPRPWNKLSATWNDGSNPLLTTWPGCGGTQAEVVG